MSFTVSQAATGSPGVGACADLLALRDVVLARGGAISTSELGVLLAAGPGWQVASVLDAVDASGVFCDDDGLSPVARVHAVDAGRLSLVQVWDRQIAWAEAGASNVAHAFASSAVAGGSDRFDVAAVSVREELALVTGCSATFAQGRIDTASLLHPGGLLAETHAALARGWITPSVARLIATAALELDPPQVRDLQSRVLPRLVRDVDPLTGVGVPRTYSRAREAINRAVTRIDPDRARRRRSQARHHRGVSIRPLPEEGVAIVTATLPIADAVEIWEHITDLALTLQTEDHAKADTGEITHADVRSLAHLRADILVEALTRAVALLRTGQPLPARPTWRVGLLIDLPTLTALREGRSELPGIGLLDPELARILAGDATWQVFIHSPLTGEILDAGAATYQPSTRLRDFIRTRDPVCTFPGCRRRSHRCQIDHITPWPRGTTIRDNLQPLCQHHHNLKTHGNWHVQRHSDTRATTWTSPRGLTTSVDNGPPF